MTTEFDEASSDGDAARHERAKLAGAKLVELVKGTAIHGNCDTRHSQGALFEHEKKVLDDCFRAGQESSTFARYHVEAVRAAIHGQNRSVLQTLLSKDQTHRVLDGEQDILQLATSRGDHEYDARSEKMPRLRLAIPGCNHDYDVQSEEMARLLVTHGANVDGLDNNGNTPLYYCCLHGYPKTFQYLINQGARFSTLHDQVPAGSAPTTSSAPQKCNLLQVAAYGLDKSKLGQGHNAYVYARWSSIVTLLIKAGLNISLDDPTERELFTSTCHEGELDNVRLLLEHGLQFELKRKPSDRYAHYLAPGLHAAVLKGHHLVVLHLLQSGCRPTWTCSYKGKDWKEHYQTAIAAACMLDSDSPETPRPPGFFLACEAIIDAGGSDHDAHLLLEEAAKHDELNTVRRTLDAGARLEHVPPCKSSRVALAFLESGAVVDSERFDLLEWLDKKDRRLLPPTGGLNLTFCRASNDVLRYLVTEYGRDSQGFGLRHAAMCTDVLRLAVRSYNREIIDLILSQDSTSRQFDFQRVVRELLRNRVSCYNHWGYLCDIQMIQLLFVHINPNAGAEYAGRPKIWLRPSMMPPELMGETFAPSDPELHTRTTLLAEQSESSTNSSPFTYKHPAEKYCGDMPLREHIPLPGPPSTIPRIRGSTFAYGRLESQLSIRLLILEPSEHMQQPIKARLVQGNLAQKPEYEALSYVWGDSTNKVLISLDDTAFMVTHNLWEALCRLRLPKCPRLLWIDAICINQDNLDERNQQVGIMKNIYQSAKRVVIWVGEEADDSHLVFQHVRMWKKYRDDYKAGITKLNDPFVGEAHFNQPMYEGRTAEAFQQLCRRPWFFRTWTIQEKALSRDAIMVCGQDAEDWSLLLGPEGGCESGALNWLGEVHGSTHLCNLAILRVNAKVESVIKHSRLCKATDPRDKVYGILGLFKRPMLPVDYNFSFEAVYTRLTQVVIQQEESLRLLHLFGSRERKQSLPSWVPDFNTSMPIILLPRFSHRTIPESPVRDYMERTPPSLRFHESEMSLKGCILDTIHAVSDELVADIEHAPGKRAFTEVMQNWESLAVQLRQKRFSHSILAAFLRTLRAQEKTWHQTEDHYESTQALAWYGKFGTGILGSFEKESFRELEVIAEWFRWRRSWRSKDSDAERYTHHIKTVCYGRSFFITRNGSMGLALPGAAAGDLIVWFPGGLYPFILRPQEKDKFAIVGDCHLHNFCEFDFTMDDIEGFEQFTLV